MAETLTVILCQVTLIPEEKIGYVLFANVTATALQQGSIALVFDTLLGEEKEDAGLGDINTDELVGNYIANFGPFKGRHNGNIDKGWKSGDRRSWSAGVRTQDSRRGWQMVFRAD